MKVRNCLSSLKINAPTVCDDLPKKNESYVGTYIKVKTNVKKFTKTDKGWISSINLSLYYNHKSIYIIIKGVLFERTNLRRNE